MARLAFKARVRLVDSPMYLANFRILNTLNNRKALKATSECAPPTKKNDKYLGIVDNKSMTPKKLKIYLRGFFTVITLAIYSNENSIVITHSAAFKKSWYCESILCILSSITKMMLAMIVIKRPMLKTLP
mgnify:CR=1 FL=1